MAVPTFIVYWTAADRRKGDVLIYDPATDLLILPRINRRIESARTRVSFSREHYGIADGFFELNLVLDGVRIAFLASSVANGFTEPLNAIHAIGLKVTDHRIKPKG